MSEPPRWTIRRPAAILAASVVTLVVAGVPAWAGASIAPAEVTADTDQPLTLTVTEPTAEAYGDTERVVVTAPAGFTVISCDSTPIDWSCATTEDGTRLVLTRTSPVPLDDTRDFGFTVHTAVVNGQYAFKVTQADGPPSEEQPPTTVTTWPAVTVTGGREPSPEPTPPADDGGSQDGGSQDRGSQDDGGSQTDGGGTDADANDPPDAGTSTGGETGSDSGDDTSSTDTSSEGSTAPRRTQGRASGTTLEITPGEGTDDPSDVTAPNVANDPAIAPPDDAGATDDSTAVAATGAEASEEPGGGLVWQQWVGAAMLLVGLATVGVRWLRQRRPT